PAEDGDGAVGGIRQAEDRVVRDGPRRGGVLHRRRPGEADRAFRAALRVASGRDKAGRMAAKDARRQPVRVGLRPPAKRWVLPSWCSCCSSCFFSCSWRPWRPWRLGGSFLFARRFPREPSPFQAMLLSIAPSMYDPLGSWLVPIGWAGQPAGV